MIDTDKKPRKKSQWIPLFDNRTRGFLANQNFKAGTKLWAVAAMAICLMLPSHAMASDTHIPRGLPTANTAYSHYNYRLQPMPPTRSFTLPTAGTSSVDPSNVATTGASASFPIKQRETYFDHRTMTLRQAAPVISQNHPARADMVVSRDRTPNYFTGDSGIPTDFSR